MALNNSSSKAKANLSHHQEEMITKTMMTNQSFQTILPMKT